MVNAIEKFIDEKRDKWLKDHLKNAKTPSEEQEITEEANKKYDYYNWILDASNKAYQLTIITHNAKYTHPDAKYTNNSNHPRRISPVIFFGKNKNDGFLRSGNINIMEDVTGNAAALSTLNFLRLQLSDGKTILEHLENDTDMIRNYKHFKDDYKDIREKFLKIKCDTLAPATNSLIKQVYFPVENDKYHLLSILTPSSVLLHLVERINELKFSEKSKLSKDKKRENKYCPDGHEIIPNLTRIMFGGSNSQNIGDINVKINGQAYLLSCLPPVLKVQCRPPKNDFFKNSIRYKDISVELDAMQKLISADWNNKNIRSAMDYHINSIMDIILYNSFNIREIDAGWSDDEKFARLAVPQKIWLDSINKDLWVKDQKWPDEIIDMAARWINDYFFYKRKQTGIFLGDDLYYRIHRVLENRKEDLI